MGVLRCMVFEGLQKLHNKEYLWDHNIREERMRIKKLLLINPIPIHTRKPGESISTITAPLSLGIIAALTPADWEINIIDENFEEFAYVEADLVGLTALTYSVMRAYEIASIYKDKGIPTVMGGIHASMVPGEAEKFVDSVVIGEAESIWLSVINDFNNGTLKKQYRGEFLSADKIPMPRRDLFHKSYLYASIQTTRGCPMRCDFCSTHTYNGQKYRQRPIEDVLDELESIPNDHVNFVDDNLIGYSKQATERAINLFKAIIDRGIKKNWYCQASLNIVDDEEVLKWAAKSGCRMILIGIESEKEKQLEEVSKVLNLKMGVKTYQDAFDRIHKHGIAVLGTLIYGYDNDTVEDLFARTKFIIESGLDGMQASILTPAPGTELYNRLKRENRLLRTNYPEDWKYYHFNEIVFRPMKMSPEELSEAMLENWSIMYDNKLLLKKMLRTLKETGNSIAAISAYLSNVHRHNNNIGKSQLPIDPNTFLQSFQSFQF